MVQQQLEAERERHAEATRIAPQTSTQLNAEFRMMEYDTSAEKDEFNGIRMQEFAIQAEEAIDDVKNASCTLVNHLWNKLHAHSLEPSTQSSAFEIIESVRQRLQNHKSFLVDGARKQENQHHQEVTVMQKKFDAASVGRYVNVAQRGSRVGQVVAIHGGFDGVGAIRGDPQAEDDHHRIALVPQRKGEKAR